MISTLLIEALLHYYAKYCGRMGHYRPIFDYRFVSKITEKEHSIHDVLKYENSEVFLCQEFPFVAYNITEDESLLIDIKHSLYNDLIKLKNQFEKVAKLYNLQVCQSCQSYSEKKYCSEMCENSIPCDKCHIRRLPHFFDLKNSFETSVDKLECVFCKGSESALDKEETYIYSCLTLIFRQLFNHACKNYGQPMLCQDCDMFFMSKPIEDGKEKSQCYCCKIKL